MKQMTLGEHEFFPDGFVPTDLQRLDANRFAAACGFNRKRLCVDRAQFGWKKRDSTVKNQTAIIRSFADFMEQNAVQGCRISHGYNSYLKYIL